MRVRYIIAGGMLCFAMVGQAQQVPEQEQDNRHTIGLNATGLLRNLVDSDNENELPYLVTYQLNLEKIVFRAGLGPEYREETVTHEGFTDSQKNTDLRIDGRIGAGIRFIDDDRWSMIGGVDVIGFFDLDKTTDDTGFDKVTDEIESVGAGLGPFLQVSYKLSPTISIATEGALYIQRYKTTHTELFENFPDFNNQLSKTTGTVLDTFLPTSIFVHIHF